MWMLALVGIMGITNVPCTVLAGNIVQKIYCTSTNGYDNLDALKKDMVIQAKQMAVNELFGEVITSFTKVESGILTADKIQVASAGFIRIKDNPTFYNGKNLGEICVSIDAYVTEEDKQQFQPVMISKKHCATEPSFTTRQLKTFAEEQAIISGVLDYEKKLEGKNNHELLKLVHQVKYLETGFVPETETYCVKFEGVIYPIELLIARVTEKFIPNDKKCIPTDCLLHHFKKFGYEFGWKAGDANSKDASRSSYFKIKDIVVTDGLIEMKYNWENGILYGTLTGNTFKGQWRQDNGSGDCELIFESDFSKAIGWWNKGGDTSKYSAFIR